jgi:hypothetical protein
MMMKLNNYIRVERHNDEFVSGRVIGFVKVNDLVEVYDLMNNPLGIYSHIEAISVMGIHYDSIDEGTSASFYLPGINSQILDKGYKIVVVE